MLFSTQADADLARDAGRAFSEERFDEARDAYRALAEEKGEGEKAARYRLGEGLATYEAQDYRGARAANRMRFTLEAGAQMLGWDLLALGLPAGGQAFDVGRYEQHLELPGVWLERGIIDCADPLSRRLLESPLGWDGQTTLATLWCAAGSDWPEPLRQALLESARQVLDASTHADRSAATSPDARVIVVRALAPRVEPPWLSFQAIRHAWRRLLWNLDESSPRVWRT
jgi:urease accessory protein